MNVSHQDLVGGSGVGPVESVEFDDYVKLPNPHQRQAYAHREKFKFGFTEYGMSITDKVTSRVLFVPWARLRGVTFAEAAASDTASEERRPAGKGK